MNNQIQEFARNILKESLSQLPDGHQVKFKRMYSPENLDAPRSDVVDSMPEDKLDWAMQQVEYSIARLNV